MYIHTFEIGNFKIHRDTSIELHPITVFVGPNSGGKSAVFDALINFSMICRGSLFEAFSQFPYSFDALLHHGASSSAKIRYSVSLSETSNSSERLNYTIEFLQIPNTDLNPEYRIHTEELALGRTTLFARSRDINRLRTFGLDVGQRSIFAAIRRSPQFEEIAHEYPLLAHCAREISRIGRYRLDPALLARPGRVFDLQPGVERESTLTPRLSYRGEDLASLLFFLSETDSPILDQIVERVAQAITGFDGFAFNRVGSDRVGLSVRFSDERGSVVAPNLSDGCLAMAGLVALALTPGRPSILCIEEPENGLTPKATRVFYQTIREIVEAGRTQVLLASHSPFVIVDAWNGQERNYIYQCHPGSGTAVLAKFAEIVPTAGHLQSDGRLGLPLAEQIMDGFRYSP